MCVFFPTILVWNISHFTMNSAQYYHKCTQVFTQTYPLFFLDFNETWISLKDLKKKKFLKHQILWKSAQWEQNCSTRTDRQTDRHDKTHSSVSQCCNHSYKFNILYGLQMESKQWQPYSFNKTVHMLQFPQLTLPIDCSYFVKDLTDKMSCSLKADVKLICVSGWCHSKLQGRTSSHNHKDE